MQSAVDVNAGANLSIAPNGEEITIEKYTSIVDEAIAADAEVCAVIASKRRLDLCTASNFSE